MTVPVGGVSPEAERLLAVTRESLERAIGVVKAGARVHDIGAAVQQHVEAHGYSVVREFVGHGIGTSLHEEPQIPNYGTPGRGSRLAEGMVLAIEPMVNAGKAAVKVLGDGWTAVTKDGSLSAHFEHTVAVTGAGCRVLTLRDQVVAGGGVTEAEGTVIAGAAERPGEGGARGGTHQVIAHHADPVRRNYVEAGGRRSGASGADAGRE